MVKIYSVFFIKAHLRRHMEIHNRIENYNPRQRKLRNLIIEEEKSMIIGLHSAQELDVGPTEIIVESINATILPDEVTDQRLCPEDGFPAEVMEHSIIITATAIPIEDCET